MPISQSNIAGRDLVITTEEIFSPSEEKKYTSLGFVARVSSAYEKDGSDPLPYQGEFVKDQATGHTIIYKTEIEAHSAAVSYATARLSSS